MTTKVDNINSQVIKVRSSLTKTTDHVRDRSLPFSSSGFCVHRTDGKPKRECKDITQDCIVQGLHGRSDSMSHVREPGGGIDKTLPPSPGARNRGLAHTVSVILSNDRGRQSDPQAEIEREGVVRYQVAAALQKIAVDRTLVNGSIQVSSEWFVKSSGMRRSSIGGGEKPVKSSGIELIQSEGKSRWARTCRYMLATAVM